MHKYINQNYSAGQNNDILWFFLKLNQYQIYIKYIYVSNIYKIYQILITSIII